LTHGEPSRASPNDQEAVTNVGEAFPLRILALILGGSSVSSLATAPG
jgi:hypothetical protein